jgi:hypothetical protein
LTWSDLLVSEAISRTSSRTIPELLPEQLPNFFLNCSVQKCESSSSVRFADFQKSTPLHCRTTKREGKRKGKGNTKGRETGDKNKRRSVYTTQKSQKKLNREVSRRVSYLCKFFKVNICTKIASMRPKYMSHFPHASQGLLRSCPVLLLGS